MSHLPACSYTGLNYTLVPLPYIGGRPAQLSLFTSRLVPRFLPSRASYIVLV